MKFYKICELLPVFNIDISFVMFDIVCLVVDLGFEIIVVLINMDNVGMFEWIKLMISPIFH